MYLVRWASPWGTVYIAGKARDLKSRVMGGRRFQLNLTADVGEGLRFYRVEEAETLAFTLIGKHPELFGKVAVVEWNGSRKGKPRVVNR